MDDRLRKLSIATGAVALFVGFIFLTRWTGDEPGTVDAMDDQDRFDLMQFCFVFQDGYLPYEAVLRLATGQAVDPEDAGVLAAFDSMGARSAAQGMLNQLADQVPEEYGDDARQVAEGLQRAVDGNLDPDQIGPYVESYENLQAQAAEDCDEIQSSGGGGLFDEGGDGSDGDGTGDGDFFGDAGDFDGDGIPDDVDPDGGTGSGPPVLGPGTPGAPTTDTTAIAPNPGG